jgi:hypothetical protein
VPDDLLLRRRISTLLDQLRLEASEMPEADAAVKHRTLTITAWVTAVLEEAEPSCDSGVVTREATAIGLINAIRDLPVMVSHTGPPADREVAEEVARMILDRMPEAPAEVEPASLRSAESVTVSRADFQAILHFARVTGQKTKSQRALVDRLTAAAGEATAP